MAAHLTPGQRKPHVYQSIIGNGDSNVDCFCDLGHNHDFQRPSWTQTIERARVDIMRIHDQDGPLTVAEQRIVDTELQRARQSDPHLDRLIELACERARSL